MIKTFLGNEMAKELMQKESYMFTGYFGKWLSSRATKTLDLKVDVYMEHLAWTGTALLGNVGGNFGLMIGFSFLGLLSWALNIMRKVRCKRRNQASTQSVVKHL